MEGKSRWAHQPKKIALAIFNTPSPPGLEREKPPSECEEKGAGCARKASSAGLRNGTGCFDSKAKSWWAQKRKGAVHFVGQPLFFFRPYIKEIAQAISTAHLDLNRSVRRPTGGKAARDGRDSTRRRPGMSRQEVGEWRASPGTSYARHGPISKRVAPFALSVSHCETGICTIDLGRCRSSASSFTYKETS
jgi:hypothetical protein